MSALAYRRSRRLARFGGSVCGATDLVLGWLHPLLAPTPPAPPHDGNRPHGGQTEQEKGRTIVKIFKGGSGILEKPVDGTAYYHVSCCFSKQKCPTGCLQNPRVMSISTRNRSFSTRVGFLRFFRFAQCIYLYLFDLYKEREIERALKNEISIHGFFFAYAKLTTGFISIFRKPVDEIGFPWTRSPYKSTSCAFSPGFPRSTGRNAYTPLEKVRNER